MWLSNLVAWVTRRASATDVADRLELTIGAAARRTEAGGRVILIGVKWSIKPYHADTWLDVVHEFTQATRAEPAPCSATVRSVDDPIEYVLVESFADGAAGAATSGPTTSGPRPLRSPTR